MEIIKNKLSAALTVSKKAKFVLIIGDEGAILTLCSEKKLEEKIFVSLNSNDDIQKLKEILNKNSKIPIALLVDVMEQSYVTKTFPSVSSFTINKLVKRRLDKDFAPTDLKGSILIGRDKTGRRDWNFLLISAPYIPPLSSWIEIITSMTNNFEGVFMLPIEAEKIISQLCTVFSNNKYDKKITGDKWNLLLAHNKVTGFRQIAFKNGKISFTRQISIDYDTTPNFMAGSIEQEISNSLEYLKRLSFKDEDTLDIHVIVSREIKNSLQKSNSENPNLNMTVLTPSEAAKALNFDFAVGQEDRFSDVFLSIAFARNKHILSFIPKDLKEIFFLEKVLSLIYKPTYLIIPAILIYFFNLQYQIYSIDSDIVVLQKKRLEILKEYNKNKSIANSMGDVNKINEIVLLYKKLIEDQGISPIDSIKRFVSAKNHNIFLKSMDWNIDYNVNKLISMTTPRPGYAKSYENNKISIVFELEISNQKGYQFLFDDFDKFTKNLNSAFVNYSVDYSKLNESININDIDKAITVRAKINGPNS